MYLLLLKFCGSNINLSLIVMSISKNDIMSKHYYYFYYIQGYLYCVLCDNYLTVCMCVCVCVRTFGHVHSAFKETGIYFKKHGFCLMRMYFSILFTLHFLIFNKIKMGTCLN